MAEINLQKPARICLSSRASATAEAFQAPAPPLPFGFFRPFHPFSVYCAPQLLKKPAISLEDRPPLAAR
jgi:hypothetical protein